MPDASTVALHHHLGVVASRNLLRQTNLTPVPSLTSRGAIHESRLTHYA